MQLSWEAALMVKGRVCSAFLWMNSFRLSSFVSTSWSRSSRSLGATGAQETQPQAPFCFPCLSVAFFVHLPFYQGPCGVNCWSPAWPLSRSSPRGFPCAYVFAVTLSTAYSTLGLARSLTGFLLQGLLLPNLGFFFSAFYSDLWIKNGKFRDMLSVFPAGNASGKLSLSQGKSTAFLAVSFQCCTVLLKAHYIAFYSSSICHRCRFYLFESIHLISLSCFISWAVPGPCISQVGCAILSEEGCHGKQVFLCR